MKPLPNHVPCRASVAAWWWTQRSYSWGAWRIGTLAFNPTETVVHSDTAIHAECQRYLVEIQHVMLGMDNWCDLHGICHNLSWCIQCTQCDRVCGADPMCLWKCCRSTKVTKPVDPLLRLQDAEGLPEDIKLAFCEWCLGQKWPKAVSLEVSHFVALEFWWFQISSGLYTLWLDTWMMDGWWYFC